MVAESLRPESLLDFFELAPFVRRWESFEFPPEELGNLQIEIMANPRAHPVIKGTHGIRKMRYAPVSQATGKSGGLRVCYVYFEKVHCVVLIIVYAKNEQDTIPASMKPALNKAVDQVEIELQRLFPKRGSHGKKEKN